MVLICHKIFIKINKKNLFIININLSFLCFLIFERGQEQLEGGDESRAGVVVHTLELFLLNLKLPVYSHGCVGKHRKHPSGRGNACGQHHHRIGVRPNPKSVFWLCYHFDKNYGIVGSI